MASELASSAPMDTDTSVPESTDAPKVQKVFETFSWDNLQSNLTQLCPSSNRTPPASDKNSAFLDLQILPVNMDGRDIAKALPDTAIATKFRSDTRFIQIFFEEEDEADNFIAQRTLEVGTYTIPILPPKGKLPSVVLIRLDNVPCRGRKYLTNELNEIMAEFCLPLEIAPMTVKGTKLFTSRWEMLVEAIPDKNLSNTLPSIIEIEGQKILLTWPGSPPSCLQCLTTGHIRRNCPKRNKPAPVPNQTRAPPQTKIIPPNPANTYASIASQKAPSRTTPVKGNLNDNTEYQGPTGLYDTARPSTPTQIGVPGSSQITQGPIHDPESPFNDPMDTQPRDTTTQSTNPSKKRLIHVSPSGSPRQTTTTTVYQKLTDPNLSDNTNTNLTPQQSN